MKAIIMAGGEGTRLRPMTSEMPKPLAPVLGESVMTHILRLLCQNDIRDAGVTLMFKPDMIMSKYGSKFENTDISYFIEGKPLGTAGSVKNAESFLLDSARKSHEPYFLIISGDAVCDTDVKSAVQFHKSSGADVTLILTRAKKPLEFGIVLTENDENGRIVSFMEKPSWLQVFTDTVNTGIYIINNDILKLIPDNQSYDFGKDLFPYLLYNGYKLFGYIDENYWCDVGDIQSYYETNRQALDGKIKVIRSGQIYKKTDGHKYISEHSFINGAVSVSEYCIIMDGVTIGSGSTITESVLFNGVKIGSNTVIEKSIVCENVTIGSNVKINEGVIIGSGSIISDNTVIHSSVKIWNNININKGKNIMSNVYFNRNDENLYDEDGIKGVFNGNLTTEYCIKIGHAAGIASSDKNRIGRVGIMCGIETVNASLIHDAILCGICTSGVKSYDFGSGFEAMAAFAAGTFRLDALLFIDDIFYGHDKVINRIKIYDRNMLHPSRPFERKFESALIRDDNKNSPDAYIYETEKFHGLSFLYFSEILKLHNRSLKEFKVCVKSDISNRNGTAPHILKKVLIELNADIVEYSIIKEYKNLLILELSDNGFDLNAYDNSGIKYDFWHIILLLEKYAIKDGLKEISLPYISPHILESFAGESGTNVYKYLSCAYEDMIEEDIKAKSKIMSQIYFKDAVFAAVYLCTILHDNNLSLNECMAELPAFDVKTRDLSVDNDKKTMILRQLSKNHTLSNDGEKYCSCKICAGNKDTDLRVTEGIRFDYGRGFVHVISKKHGGFKLFAESRNSEISEELLTITDAKIKKLLS